MPDKESYKSFLDPCKFCKSAPEVYYEPGATITQCYCKKIVLPDGGDPETFQLIMHEWNNNWKEKAKVIINDGN